jgi:hypothetical protein
MFEAEAKEQREFSAINRLIAADDGVQSECVMSWSWSIPFSEDNGACDEVNE